MASGDRGELEAEPLRSRGEMHSSVEQSFHLLQDVSDYAILVLDASGLIRAWNSGAERMKGYSPEEIIGRHYSVLFSDPDRAAGRPEILMRQAGEAGSTNDEGWRRHKDGHLFWAEVSLTAIRKPDGSVSGFTKITRDVTRRRAQLLTSEARLTTLLNCASQAIIGIGADGLIQLANPMAERVFGHPPGSLIGQPLAELIPERVRYQHNLHLAGYMHSPKIRPMGAGLELMGRRRDGSEFPVEVSLSYVPAGDSPMAVAFVSDITERKRAEAVLRETEMQLRQSQKVEAIGQLVSGVAHDFNNILTVINGRASLLRSCEEFPDDIGLQLDEIIGAGERAAALTRRLLAFSRQQNHQIRTIDLNDVLIGLLSLLRRVLRVDIVMDILPGDDLPPIRADQIQMEQVILNLVINAQDAMPEAGTLSVRTWTDAARSQAMMSIADCGVGILLSIRERIFEPFFTTKENSQGTGLGLSTVHAIVSQLDGRIEVESEMGVGSTFTLYFPAATAEPETGKVVALPRRGRDGSILVVENDPAVRRYIETALQNHGYEVQAASDGSLALEVAGSSRPFDLLLAEVILPGMSGHRLAERLRDFQPALKVLYMSGYSESIAMHSAAGDFLGKPFNVDTLLDKVHQVLYS